MLKNLVFILALLFSGVLFATEKIDINTADAQSLSALKGIGETKAEAIVTHRTKHGPFSSADDLSLVSGIGPKTVDKNRDLIVVGKAETPEGKTSK